MKKGLLCQLNFDNKIMGCDITGDGRGKERGKESVDNETSVPYNLP
jgi:hypothetical protein